MSLTAGTKLGPYEIVSPLGAGGMAEVYRARDTRLDRLVAIKVLPHVFADDPERLRRFELEARAIAALNHPNILAVHDIGQEGQTRYIVEELLDGEMLRDKLANGPLPQRKAVEYAVQIAAGLAAAHERGIVHRDLKPENLFVMSDGRVKVLDFGLAKELPRPLSSAASQGATLATVTPAGTAAGMVLGTVGYMSPEQVRGEESDSRSDIFSFGAVLYEMLSGRRAFQHNSSVETMNAILKEDVPDLEAGAIRVSPGVERIVRRCLEKDPRQRFQSAKDLGFALESTTASSQTSTQVRASVPRRGIGMLAAAVLATVALIGAGYFAGSRRATSPASLQRVTFERGYIRGAHFTPDGQNVVYSMMKDDGQYEIFSTRIGDHTSRPLGFKNAIVLGVASNGDIALLTNVRRIKTTRWMQVGTLSRAPASGGAARELLEDVWDADISRDGTQFAVVRTPNGPHQLEYPVGQVLDATNGYISEPRISPDGKSVAYFEHPVFADDRGYVVVCDKGGKPRHLTEESSTLQGLAWSPDGSELYYGGVAAGSHSQERMLFAVTRSGKSRPVYQMANNITLSDVAFDGRMLIANEVDVGAAMAASPSNSAPRDISVLGHGAHAVFSWDAKTVAFTESGSGTPLDYLVYSQRAGDRAAVEIGEGSALAITPDGRYVVAMIPSQRTKIRLLPTGAGEVRTFDVAPVEVDYDFVSWMPGGKEFVFLGHEGPKAPHAYVASIEGGPVRPLTKDLSAHFWNRVSPDGKYVIQGPGVALLGTTTNWGTIPMEVVELATGQARQAALQPGDEPIVWSEDGRHLYVAHENRNDATIFRVDPFTGHREVWREIRQPDPAGLNTLTSYTVTPSGNAYGYTLTRVLSSLYVYSTR